MAKSKRRPTLREQVDKLKRQNRALERYWDEAHRDFVIMTRIAEQSQHIAKQSQEETKQVLEQTKQLLERNRALLKVATRDPTMPLQ